MKKFTKIKLEEMAKITGRAYDAHVVSVKEMDEDDRKRAFSDLLELNTQLHRMIDELDEEQGV